MFSLRFAEAYVEGTWYPVDAFLVQAGAPSGFKSELEKIRWIQTVCKAKIQYDNGVAGVVVPDHADGRKRVRLGFNSQVGVSQEPFFVCRARHARG